MNLKKLIISLCLVAASLGLAIAQTNRTGQTLPLIQLSHVPLIFAVENLARQTGINFMLDPKLSYGVGENILDPSGKPIPEPIITIHWANTSAGVALKRLLKEYHLVMVSDPITSVARIGYPNQPAKALDAGLLSDATNTVLPLIVFQGTPLDVTLDNLIQQAGIHVALDPKLSDPIAPLSTVSLRWQNMTAKQAIIAICENYNLAIVKDTTTGALQIKPNK